MPPFFFMHIYLYDLLLVICMGPEVNYSAKKCKISAAGC